jgi:26S proteasome regulatory subunit T5
MTHKSMFDTIAMKPPKGVLLHGRPSMGKTLLVCACTNQTNIIFLKLTSPQLVQMFIGDRAKLIRDMIKLAKEKIADGTSCGAIIFIIKFNAIGAKPFSGNQPGDREVQHTMLELLSQLDGFSSNDMIKVIGATNRLDILDPVLLRSGPLDCKIELS